MDNPNEVQYGGDHYKQAGDKQHWDMLAALGFGWEYYIGCATKYLTRVKDQENDPRKATHFIDKLISLIEIGKIPSAFRTTQGTRLTEGGNTQYNLRVDAEAWLYDVYFPANKLDRNTAAARVILSLMMANDLDDLRAARMQMGYMLGEATAEYVDQSRDQDTAAERLQAAMTTANAGALTGRFVVDKDGNLT